MSKFISGGDSVHSFTTVTASTVSKMRRGENGTMEYTEEGVGDNLVAAFFALVRNTPKERITLLIKACIEDTNKLSWPMEVRVEAMVDLFLLTFQTRNCRGGKGEKDLFYTILILLYKEYPDTVIQLLPLIAHYGYYKDYFNLLENFIEQEQELTIDNGLKMAIIELIAKQLKSDYEEITCGKSNPIVSLCAKYCPREGTRFASKKNKEIFHELLHTIFPELPEKQRKSAYRKLVVSLSKHLNITEIKMCSHHYADIDFHMVPSLCALKFRKAFLNEKLEEKIQVIVSRTKRGLQKYSRKVSTSLKNSNNNSDNFDNSINMDITGDRYPNDPDRVKCRQHLRETIKANKIKGKQVYPHLIVKNILGKKFSTLESDLYGAQWNDIRKSIVEKLSDSTKPSTPNTIRLDRFVPLVDVSGSMSGDPMLVAIALGILVSEITHPAFQNRIITFESKPQWVILYPNDSITQKVQRVAKAPWGGSTNIEKAFELIRDIIVSNKLSMEEVPDLFIFSDMQFDEAIGGGGISVSSSMANQLTQYKRIQKLFHSAGMKVCGKPYAPPRIVFWNLRSTGGYPATATMENVQMLSGFSPSMLELVMSGEEIDDTTNIVLDENGNEIKQKVNPYETFRKAMDQEYYDKVRLVLSNSTEKLLAYYSFELPTEAVVMVETEETENEDEDQSVKKTAKRSKLV